MRERKVLGWAVRWLDESDSKGNRANEWARIVEDSDMSVVDRSRSWLSRKERTLLSEQEAKDLADDIRRGYGEPVSRVAAVRIVAKPKAPKLCMLSRAPNGLEYCRLPKGHGGPVHIDFGEGWSNPWLTNGTKLVPESDPKPDKLEQAIAVVRKRAELARECKTLNLRDGNIGMAAEWHGADVELGLALATIEALR